MKSAGSSHDGAAPHPFPMETHKTAIAGVGGILAMFTLEKFNVLLGTLVGVLTLVHLGIQIVKHLRK
jgi:hypothetical protein